MLRTRNKATPILRPKRNFRATGNRAALWRYWQRWGTRLSADRRSQQLLTRLRARVAAGQELADQFRPTDLEEWFAMSSTTAQDWLHQWQVQGLLEPSRPRGSESAVGACASRGSSGC